MESTDAMRIERQAIINAVSTLEMQVEALRRRAVELDLAIARLEAPPVVMHAPSRGGAMHDAKVKSTCRSCGTRTTRAIISRGYTVAECQRCADAAQSPFAQMVQEALAK